MKISVALCTYNGADFLDLQLSSIINQSMPVNEIVIVDDGSNDHTGEILNSFREKYSTVIKLFKNEVQMGVIKNFEKAISLCAGDWIFLSDQDDIWEKDKVEKMMAFAVARHDALLIYTDAWLINDNGDGLNKKLWEAIGFTETQQKKWKNNWYAFTQLAGGANRITGATVLMSALLKQKAIPFLELPAGYFHDAYLALLAASEKGLYYLNSPLISYRIHTKQQVGIGQGIFVAPGDMGKYMASLDRFLKQLSKKLGLKYRILLFVIQYKKTLFKWYSKLPEKNPLKRLYKKVFR